MKLLVVGSGGREHALCWALGREHADTRLYCAPGNPGTAEFATNLPVAADDIDGLVAAVMAHDVDLTVIGPEIPLAHGLVDRLRSEGRIAFGPTAAAAQLEASKAFSKEVMAAAGVPTAASHTFTDLAAALAYIDQHPEPLVVKASGLAAGKGAIVCATRAEAATAVRMMLADGTFGEAGQTVVVERFLEGEELSVLAITDGRDLEVLSPSQDHKRLLEGDTGPNTGGMGAYSPVSLATPALLNQVRQEILLPMLDAMQRRGTPFTGVLYAGLMIDAAGSPSVIEFNCRFGDPETQVILPLVSNGLTECLWRAARGEGVSPVTTHPGMFAVTTVLAAAGYPDAPVKGALITLPAPLPEGVTVFHAGTARGANGALRVNGGRVLNVTAVAPTFAEAQRRSREVAEAIRFDGKVVRRDIGWREVTRVPAFG